MNKQTDRQTEYVKEHSHTNIIRKGFVAVVHAQGHTHCTKLATGNLQQSKAYYLTQYI